MCPHYGRLNAFGSKPVLQKNINTGEIIKEWPSAREITRQLGFDYRGISASCLSINKNAYGYKWELKNK